MNTLRNNNRFSRPWRNSKLYSRSDTSDGRSESSDSSEEYRTQGRKLDQNNQRFSRPWGNSKTSWRSDSSRRLSQSSNSSEGRKGLLDQDNQRFSRPYWGNSKLSWRNNQRSESSVSSEDFRTEGRKGTLDQDNQRSSRPWRNSKLSWRDHTSSSRSQSSVRSEDDVKEVQQGALDSITIKHEAEKKIMERIKIFVDVFGHAQPSHVLSNIPWSTWGFNRAMEYLESIQGIQLQQCPDLRIFPQDAKECVMSDLCSKAFYNLEGSDASEVSSVVDTVISFLRLSDHVEPMKRKMKPSPTLSKANEMDGQKPLVEFTSAWDQSKGWFYPASLSGKENFQFWNFDQLRNSLDAGLVHKCTLKDLRFKKSGTLLHVAAKYFGRAEIDFCLDELRLDIEKKRMDQNTPILIAAYYGREDNVEYLRLRGADMTKTNQYAEGVEQLLERHQTHATILDQMEGFSKPSTHHPGGMWFIFKRRLSLFINGEKKLCLPVGFTVNYKEDILITVGSYSAVKLDEFMIGKGIDVNTVRFTRDAEAKCPQCRHFLDKQLRAERLRLGYGVCDTCGLKIPQLGRRRGPKVHKGEGSACGQFLAKSSMQGAKENLNYRFTTNVQMRQNNINNSRRILSIPGRKI